MLGKKKSIMDVGVYRVPKPSQKHQNNYKKLILAIILSSIFIVAELVGGIISHSIAVISDCLHLVTDLIGFVISFIALKYSVKKSTRMNSFGFHRVEIIGVLANLFIIWSLTLVVVVEASERVIEKAIVENPKVMLIVASGGLGVNLVMYFILHSGGHSHLGHSHCKGHTHTHDHQKHLNDQGEVGIENQEIDDKINLEQPSEPEKHHHSHGPSCDHEHDNQTFDSQKNEDQAEGSLKEPLIINDHPAETRESIDDRLEQAQSKKSKVIVRKVGGTHHHNSHSHTHAHPDIPAGTRKSQHENMSMKAAILHAITDIIQSIGLLISALLIFFLGSDHGAVVTEYNHWHLLDPISTFVFSILVIISTFPITKECFHIILEATPSDFDEQNLHTKFKETEGVLDLHDFHVWSLKPGSLLLSAHVFCGQGSQKQVLQRLTVICRQQKIYHSTIQVEALNKSDSQSPIICQNDIHE